MWYSACGMCDVCGVSLWRGVCGVWVACICGVLWVWQVQCVSVCSVVCVVCICGVVCVVCLWWVHRVSVCGVVCVYCMWCV